MESELLGSIIKVIGIAGPGDPLANEETFETFRLIGDAFPHLIKCMSTNGLLLPEKIDLLHELGLNSLTVTVNAIDPSVAAKIYSNIIYNGKALKGVEGTSILIANQLAGLKRAAEYGITIKVNTVFIPGVNEEQIPLVAREVKKLGAHVMNVLPIIPNADFAHLTPPSAEQLEAARNANEQIIGQFKHCRQCRADAVGLIGQNVQLEGAGCAV